MKKSTSRGWWIWAIVALFYLYELILRIVPSVMVGSLMKDFSITATGVGALSAFYYYAYAPLQLPIGVLIDRYGARLQLVVASFICALGSFFFAGAHSESLIAISRLLIGFGSAFAWVALTYLISHWFPAHQRGMLIGLGSSVGLIGGVAGQGPMVVLIEAIGWRATNFYLALAGLIITVAIWVIVRDSPEKQAASSTTTLKTAVSGLKSVLFNPQSWICALFSVALYLSISVFAELWGISFLESAHHLSAFESGCGTSLIYIGMLVGGPLIGMFSDRTHRRKPYMAAGAFVAAAMIAIVIFWAHLSLFAIYLALFIFGFAMASQLLSFSIIIEANRPFAKGSALAFNNFITMIGGTIMQPVVGWLLDIRSTGSSIAGYTPGDFRFALTALPISCLIGFVLALFLRETHGRSITGEVHPFEPHCD